MKKRILIALIIGAVLVLALIFSLLQSRFNLLAEIIGPTSYDVIIAGGGSGGTSAAIQSARSGAKTLLVADSDWLGGMYTEGAISAFDGPLNQKMASGLFLEIAKRIHQHYCPGVPYPCPDLAKGSVSITGFEPSIANQILHEMVADEPNLTVKYNATVSSVAKNGNTVTGVAVVDKYGVSAEYQSKVLVDATEYGDVLKLAGAAYRLGRESYHQTHEPHALGGLANIETGYNPSHAADNLTQPLTYAITLKKYATAQNISQPPDYDANKYEIPQWGWDSFTHYGWIPDSSQADPAAGYFSLFLNWPWYGNDLAQANYLDVSPAQRQAVLTQAKDHSLGFLYFLHQNVPESANWGIDNAEFNTLDKLPLIPYIRESRRLEAVEMLTEQDIARAQNPTRGVFKTNAIAVGDEYIDIHSPKNNPAKNNSSNVLPTQLMLPTVPYQIPYGSLIPSKIDGLLGAEKNIGVTHLANGATRMQPTVISIGQAAGAAAALSSRYNVPVRNLNVELLQDELLGAGSTLYFFQDVPNDYPAFKEIETVALKKIMQGSDLNFRPDAPTSRAELAVSLYRALNLSPNTIGAPHFADVSPHTFGYTEIETLYNRGLNSVFGHDCPHWYFCPLANASRATAIAAIVTGKGLDTSGASGQTFADVPSSYWAWSAIETGAGNGIIQRTDNFRPDDAATRAAVAIMFYRIIARLGVHQYQMSYNIAGDIHKVIVWHLGFVDGNVVFSDKLSSGSQLISASDGGILSGSSVGWNLGTRPANSSGVVSHASNARPKIIAVSFRRYRGGTDGRYLVKVRWKVTWSDPGDLNRIYICKTNTPCFTSRIWARTSTYKASNPAYAYWDPGISSRRPYYYSRYFYAFACDDRGLCSRTTSLTHGQFTP